jgi:hypothetical protein
LLLPGSHSFESHGDVWFSTRMSGIGDIIL